MGEEKGGSQNTPGSSCPLSTPRWKQGGLVWTDKGNILGSDLAFVPIYLFYLTDTYDMSPTCRALCEKYFLMSKENVKSHAKQHK